MDKNNYEQSLDSISDSAKELSEQKLNGAIAAVNNYQEEDSIYANAEEDDEGEELTEEEKNIVKIEAEIKAKVGPKIEERYGHIRQICEQYITKKDYDDIMYYIYYHDIASFAYFYRTNKTTENTNCNKYVTLKYMIETHMLDNVNKNDYNEAVNKYLPIYAEQRIEDTIQIYEEIKFISIVLQGVHYMCFCDNPKYKKSIFRNILLSMLDINQVQPHDVFYTLEYIIDANLEFFLTNTKIYDKCIDIISQYGYINSSLKMFPSTQFVDYFKKKDPEKFNRAGIACNDLMLKQFDNIGTNNITHSYGYCTPLILYSDAIISLEDDIALSYNLAIFYIQFLEVEQKINLYNKCLDAFIEKKQSSKMLSCISKNIICSLDLIYKNKNMDTPQEIKNTIFERCLKILIDNRYIVSKLSSEDVTKYFYKYVTELTDEEITDIKQACVEEMTQTIENLRSNTDLKLSPSTITYYIARAANDKLFTQEERDGFIINILQTLENDPNMHKQYVYAVNYIEKQHYYNNENIKQRCENFKLANAVKCTNAISEHTLQL